MTGQLLSALSLILFAISLYTFSKTSVSKPSRIAFSTGVFTYIILFSAYLVADYFTGKGINDAVIYHIKYGLKGAGFGEYSNVIIASSIAITIALLMVVYIIIHKPQRSLKKPRIKALLAAIFALSLLINPFTRNFFSLASRGDEPAYDFYNHCKSGDLTETSKHNPNFVFIYLEGLERTYFDEDIFPNLIKGLKKLEKESVYFTNIVQAAGTGWTMGGVVASQCGIPLFTPSHGNSMSGMDQFLPNAICLGDLLHKKGYYLSYLGGANLDFAGKGKFFTTHHFSEVNGRKKLIQKLDDQSYTSSWGLYDDSLLYIAYKRFIELSKKSQHFGLFLLTLDTHHPSGHQSKSASSIVYGDGKNSILNAVAGSDFLITQFVDKIRGSEFGDNTVVIIASDHLTLKNTAYDLLQQTGRSGLFMIIPPQIENAVEISKRGTTLDIASTILPFLGYRGNVGLGRDLVRDNSLEESLGGISKHLHSWKDDLLSLWRFPNIEKQLLITPGDRTVRVDDRLLKYPLLIELNEELETNNIKFEFYRDPEHKRLKDHLGALENGERFIWVDSCNEIQQYYDINTDHRYCIIIGRTHNDSPDQSFIGEVLSSNDPITIDKKTITKILSK